MYKYLEIARYDGGMVIKRFDVTNKSERSIDRLENGININLNHDEYFIQLNDSEVELPIIL